MKKCKRSPILSLFPKQGCRSQLLDIMNQKGTDLNLNNYTNPTKFKSLSTHNKSNLKNNPKEYHSKTTTKFLLAHKKVLSLSIPIKTAIKSGDQKKQILQTKFLILKITSLMKSAQLLGSKQLSFIMRIPLLTQTPSTSKSCTTIMQSNLYFSMDCGARKMFQPIGPPKQTCYTLKKVSSRKPLKSYRSRSRMKQHPNLHSRIIRTKYLFIYAINKISKIVLFMPTLKQK